MQDEDGVGFDPHLWARAEEEMEANHRQVQGFYFDDTDGNGATMRVVDYNKPGSSNRIVWQGSLDPVECAQGQERALAEYERVHTEMTRFIRGYNAWITYNHYVWRLKNPAFNEED